VSTFASVYHISGMYTDAATMVALSAGLFGALAVTYVGIRLRCNPRVLVSGGILSGVALGEIMHASWDWFTHGFELSQVGMPLLAALVLVLVMAGQNWFVFYEDRRDALQSSLPALVMFVGAVASALIGIGKHALVHRLIWACAGSLVLLLCINPMLQSIQRTRSVFGGTLIAIGKILVPFSGVSLFLWRLEAGREASIQNRFLTNVIGIFLDLGRLALTILINGARIPLCTQASMGEMSRLKRDSVVVIFVLAIHVLCGSALVKA
jgi:hypothetical protein